MTNTLDSTHEKGHLIDLPVVCNIHEAETWAHQFESVLTAGPKAHEVNWQHPNHKIFTFRDITGGKDAPTIEAVEEAIDWGVDQDDLLVHCHAGMSRSTALAWGISIAKGVEPLEAFLALREAQPVEGITFRGKETKRDFIPNRLIVNFLDEIFGTGQELLAIRLENQHSNWGQL